MSENARSENARRFRIEGGAPRSAFRASAPAFDMSATDSLIGFSHAPEPIPEPMSTPAVLEEIRALRAMIEPLSTLVDTLGENYRNEMRNVSTIRDGMTEIDDAIRGTKKALAAIKVGNNIGGVDVAALELTTVVTQTEAATNDILAATEVMETLAGAIQSETTLEAAKARAHEIAEKATVIYMACNFQDLSGQRVSRVVDTLNFIESRIHRMIEAWGGLQALHELIETELQVREEERETEGNASLLTGPVPVNAEGHVDQDAIDALFN